MYSIPSLRGILSKTGPAPVTGPLSFYADGRIRDQVIVGDNIYIAGDFTSVGKYVDMKTNQFCILNSTTADANYISINKTLFNGDVECSVISGSYIYVGGSFTLYNNQVCERIAKISLIDGSVDPTFNTASGFNALVRSIALDSSGNLYAGGDFTTYKGTTRQSIAKINATTAALDTTFDAESGFDNQVFSIALDGSGSLYACGAFTSYKGTTRQRIAKLNATTAALDTTFDAASGFNSTVRSIALDSSGNFYAGGGFTSYKATTRQRIAKINATTAALDASFNSASGFDNVVNVIALDGSGNLYAGGSFTSYKATTRQRIAKINATTAALDTTFDSASGFNNAAGFGVSVNSIIFDGSGSLYAGGNFSLYKGTAREFIAKLNATTAALDTTFDSASGFKGGAVQTMALDGSGTLYVGGLFGEYKTLNKTLTRQKIAKISLLTGNIDTAFDSESGFNEATASVRSIALDDSGNLYAGGAFTSYKGTTRQRIAKLNATTAALDTTFDAESGFNSTVNSIALDELGNIFAGGGFNSYKGTARERIAKINGTTAALDTTFDSASGFDGTVNSITRNPSTGAFYCAGFFTAYKGTTRQYIARIHATTAALDTTFDAASGFNSTVNSIALDELGNIFAGGGFTSYKGTARERIAKINATTAALDTTFDSASGFIINGTVNAIILDGSGSLFVGGVFTTYKETAAVRLVKLNATTAALNTTFNTSTGFNGIVNSIVLDGSGNLYAGGDFTSYKTLLAKKASILDATTAAPVGY
jgi:hypothetical protein